MFNDHGIQAPGTRTRERFEVQWQPYDDGQWWADFSDLRSLEEARFYRDSDHAGRRTGRPHRIVRVQETCVREVVETDDPSAFGIEVADARG